MELTRQPEWTVLSEMGPMSPDTWQTMAIQTILTEALQQSLLDDRQRQTKALFDEIRASLPEHARPRLKELDCLIEETLYSAIEMTIALVPEVRKHWKSPAEVVSMVLASRHASALAS